MSSQSKNKTALVTGGNKAIGLAIYKGLLDGKFDVFLAARNPEKVKAAVEQLSTDSNSVQFIQLDVSDDESSKNAINRVVNFSAIAQNAHTNFKNVKLFLRHSTAK